MQVQHQIIWRWRKPPLQRRIKMEWTKELEELYQYVFEQQPSEVEMNQMASEYKEASNG